jgi:hypothetical protein
MIYAIYDTGLRNISKDRVRWQKKMIHDAANAIQMAFVRDRLARKRRAKREKAYDLELVSREMVAHENEAMIERDLYRAEVEEYYRVKRENHLKNTLNDASTAKARRAIIVRRSQDRKVTLFSSLCLSPLPISSQPVPKGLIAFANSAISTPAQPNQTLGQADREAAQKKRDDAQKKLDEEKIMGFVKKWEVKTADRLAARAALCRTALFVPETIEQQNLKRALQGRIKKQARFFFSVL